MTKLAKSQKKIEEYKGFIIASGTEDDGYPFLVFTKEEWGMGRGYREPEFYCDSLEECKENIDCY